ncbi:tyrosine-type recombinase/integrase [Paracoccus marcusii]|uniref:tyrosine-type recombinase/integrase n=1 Tax=Paracoccus marcusii TaxID=59779 RepID=UPI0039C8A744
MPCDPDWERLLTVAAHDTVRNRLMLALGYYGALRREELISLRVSDLDFAHRLVSLRAETTKVNGRAWCPIARRSHQLLSVISIRS